MRWLAWLKQHNPAYADIEIDQEALGDLPEEGFVGDQLVSMDEGEMPGPEVGVPGSGVREQQQAADGASTSGGGQQQQEQGQQQAQQQQQQQQPRRPEDDIGPADANDATPQDSGAQSIEPIAGERAALTAALERAREGLRGPQAETIGDGLPLAWPDVAQDEPFNEFTSDSYLTCGFPTLFPTGKAQFRQTRRRDVRPDEYFLHLLRHKTGKFQRNRRFRYVALNSISRWKARDIAGVFVRKNFNTLTVEELQNRVQRNDMSVLQGLLRWSQSLRGTRQYWSGVRGKAYAWLTFLEYYFDQMPTVFYTISAAEMHWNWLHKLFDESDEYLGPEVGQ